jgi:hypothetical protein
MRTKFAVWIFTALVPAANSAIITCNGGAASVPVFDPSSISGAVGDYTLDCTGGTPVLPPLPVPVVNVTAFMNVPVLNTGGWILTDGVHMTAGILGATNVVEFLGVPFNPPGAGHIFFEIENILVNPSGEPPGTQFREDVQITSDMSITILNQDQLVALNATPEPLTAGFVGVGLGCILWLACRRRAHLRQLPNH